MALYLTSGTSMRYRTFIIAAVPLTVFSVTLVVLVGPRLDLQKWSRPASLTSGTSVRTAPPEAAPADAALRVPAALAPPQFASTPGVAAATAPIVPTGNRELLLHPAEHALLGRPAIVKPDHIYDDPNAPTMPVRFLFRGPLRGDAPVASLLNLSGEELVDVRVTSVNPSTQARSVVSVQLEPHDRVDLIQQGLKVEMGDTVMLQSGHYRDQLVQAW